MEILRFTLRKPEKFPVYEMETGNLEPHILKNGLLANQYSL